MMCDFSIQLTKGFAASLSFDHTVYIILIKAK